MTLGAGKKLLFVLTAILVVLIIAVLFIPAPHKKSPSTPPNNLNLKVFEPLPNQAIQSPLTVKGEAKGAWFFEASFPVRLEDQNGNILTTAPAQAHGEWMTENFVSFEAKLEFKAPPTSKGTIVLERDDPSGRGQNLETTRLPITFS